MLRGEKEAWPRISEGLGPDELPFSVMPPGEFFVFASCTNSISPVGIFTTLKKIRLARHMCAQACTWRGPQKCMGMCTITRQTWISKMWYQAKRIFQLNVPRIFFSAFTQEYAEAPPHSESTLRMAGPPEVLAEEREREDSAVADLVLVLFILFHITSLRLEGKSFQCLASVLAVL